VLEDSGNPLLKLRFAGCGAAEVDRTAEDATEEVNRKRCFLGREEIHD